MTKWTATHNVVQVKFLNQPSVRLNYLYLVSYPNYLVDCLWDTWQSWSSCTKSCGSGTKLRSRNKVQDVLCGGTACSGNSIEQVNCNTQCCSGKDLKFDFIISYQLPNVLVNCLWDNWQSWSSCTKTCGSGTKQTSRTKQEAECGGAACTGNVVEQTDCNNQCCLGN